jgi:glycosyltransferase involved in cell wall biosynthesis
MGGNHASFADYTCFGSVSRLRVAVQTLNVSAYWTLRRILHEFKPDVVHARMFLTQLSPLILPLLQTVPSVYQMVTYEPICPVTTKLLPDGQECHTPSGRVCLQHRCVTFQTWAMLMLQKRLWLRWRSAFDRLLTLSSATKARLEAEGVAPVEVIHNGVAERPMRPPLNAPPTLAFAGRLVPGKGVDTLIRAYAVLRQAVPDAQLMIAGQGDARPGLEALSRSLGIAEHIHWLGHIAPDELERQFDRAWVQAVPSRWSEPFGNVATEAMMRGTAVVASRIGGLTEIVVDGETGFTTPPDDVEALVTALRPLLSDRALAERMGIAGRTRALTHFSLTKRTDRFIALYESMIAEKAAPGGTPPRRTG